MFDLERHWADEGTCRTLPGEVFFADSEPPNVRKAPTESTQAHWDVAKAICRTCPVLTQCRAATVGELYGVWGGLDQRERQLARRRLTREAKGWPTERRIKAGRALHTLRVDRGMKWAEVRRLTGLADDVGQPMIDEYTAQLPVRRQAPEVETVELPDIDWPSAPPTRDAWARYAGRFVDVHYQAETAEGDWFLVRLRTAAKGGQTNKWVELSDVRFGGRRPDPVIRERRITDGKEIHPCKH